MNRIRLLPEHVANQIAAGEVVERPASVVKELVENALDAQAARIIVEIQAGGRSLIRVTDDGAGMSRDDSLLCLERHATSKITSAEDLYAIKTMGFRGEALPSIASVCRMTITSREREAQTATQIIIHGGKIISVKEAGSPPGTTMEARQLFFNLPARRKFLRSEETERSHIQHYLTLAALAHPEVAFAFWVDQRLIWQIPAHPVDPAVGPPLDALRDRWRALYGTDENLLPVNFSTTIQTTAKVEEQTATEDHPLRIWGFLGAPAISRSSRENQHLFVNARPVENRGLNFAILEGYHTALMKGRYPVCCLFVEIDPSEVDVNIHPAKREIKFHHEIAVRQQMAQAVKHTLATAARRSPPQTGEPPAPAEKSDVPTTSSPAFQGAIWPEHASATSQSGIPASLLPAPMPPKPAVETRTVPVTTAPPPGNPVEVMGLPAREKLSPPAVSSASPPPAVPVSLLDVPLRYVGVVGKLYAVFESDRGLVLMDQHAAHERILFDQMLSHVQTATAPSQRLLLAETVELSPRDAQFTRENLPVLTRLGVGLSEFGERTFLLDGLPPFVKAPNSRQFVLNLIDELKATGQAINSWRLGEDVVAKTVCRHAVKANDPLSEIELQKLLENLRLCAMPYTCPHGRPTLIELNFRELEKRFGRIV